MEQIPGKDVLTEKESVKAQVARNYKWLSFLSKVGFICNLCFLLCVVVQYTKDFISNQNVKGTVIVLGFVVSFFINIILQVSMLVLRVGKRDIPIKPWLRIFNILVFVVQIIYYFS